MRTPTWRSRLATALLASPMGALPAAAVTTVTMAVDAPSAVGGDYVTASVEAGGLPAGTVTYR